MLPRQTLLLARRQGSGLPGVFSGSRRWMRRVAIDGQDDEVGSSSIRPASTLNTRSSLASLRQEAEEMRKRDLPLLNVKADEDLLNADSAAEPLQSIADDTTSATNEEVIVDGSTNSPPSATTPLTSPLRQTISPRRMPGQRNPFERRSGLQVMDNASTGLRDRSLRAEALAEASFSFDEPSGDALEATRPSSEDDFSLLSNVPVPKSTDTSSVRHSPSNRHNDEQHEARQTRLEVGESRSPAGHLRAPIVSNATATRLDSRNTATRGGLSEGSGAIARKKTDSRDDTDGRSTRPEASTTSSSRSLPRSGRDKLDRDLLEQASSAQWLPLNPDYVDGQREGCAEVGFESWTVFTKIRSDGLRTRLFARRLLAKTNDCLSLMTTLNASFLQSGGTPDSLFYKSITGKRGSIQVEVAGNLYDKRNDDEYGDVILFTMYPDVSQEQIRVIRQINAVLDASINGATTRSSQSQIASKGAARNFTEESNATGTSNDTDVCIGEEQRRGEEKSGMRERMRIIPDTARESQRQSAPDVSDFNQRRVGSQGGRDDQTRRASSDGNSRQKPAKRLPDDQMKGIASEFGLSLRARQGKSQKRSGVTPAERHATWRALSESMLKSTSTQNTGPAGTASEGRPLTISTPTYSKSPAGEKSKSSSSTTLLNSKRGNADSGSEKESTGKLTANDDLNDKELLRAMDVNKEDINATTEAPIEDATPVAIDGEQAEMNKDVDSVKPVSTPSTEEDVEKRKSTDPLKPIEEATPVFVDGEQAKSTDADNDATSTEISAASARGNLEQQAIDSSKEISKQNPSAIASQEGSLEEATPVFVEGKQAKDQVDQNHTGDKPASISDIQSESTVRAAESTTLEQGEASGSVAIDSNTVDEAVKKHDESSANVEDAVKESPLGNVGGGEAAEIPVDEATPVAVEGEQVEGGGSGTSAENVEDVKKQ